MTLPLRPAGWRTADRWTPTGGPARAASPGSGSPASPPPTRCSSAGARVVVGRRRRRAGRSGSAPRILDALGAASGCGPGGDGPLPDVAGRRRAPDLVVASPGWPPDHPLLRRPPRRASRCGATSSWPGGCAPRTGAAALADRHRHQRQDDDRADARRHPRGGRAAAPRPSATSARPCSTPCCDPEPLRRARRRALELPAALRRPRVRAAGQRLPQRRARPPRLARLARRVRRATRAASTRTPRSPACTTSPTRGPSSSSRDADVVEGCRAIGFTLGMPGRVRCSASSTASSCDRAFVDERRTSAAELATLDDCEPAQAASSPPHIVANALAAAALARAARRARRPPSATGCAASARRAPASSGSPSPTASRWVDDSKATNPHAAAASPARLRAVVWIAGGLAKGADRCRRARRARTSRRLRGAVLIGVDRASREALRRHAPELSRLRGRRHRDWADGHWDGRWPRGRALWPRARRSRAARRHRAARARCASMDQFADYAARGDAFASRGEASRRRPAGGLSRVATRLGAPPLAAVPPAPPAAPVRVGGEAAVAAGGLLPRARLDHRAGRPRPRHGAVQLERGVAAHPALLLHDLLQAGHVRRVGLPLAVLAALAARPRSGRPWPGRCCSSASARCCSSSSLGTTSTATGTGSSSAGSRLQPSEAVKLALVVWVAAVLAPQAAAARTDRARRGAGRAGRGAPARPRARRARPRHRTRADGARRGADVRRRGAAAGVRRRALARRRRGLRAGHDQRQPDGRASRLAADRRHRPARARLAAPARARGRWRPAAGGGSAWGRAGRSGPGCPRRTTTSSSRSSARSSG